VPAHLKVLQTENLSSVL